MYYLLLPTLQERDKFIQQLKLENVNSVFHYVPLHSSPGGGNMDDMLIIYQLLMNMPSD